jgi:PAS domain S-box-containing protein
LAEIESVIESEPAVSEAEKSFRSLVDASLVMIRCCGLDKCAIFLNRSWLNFTGRTMDQELGFGWAEGLHPDDRERALTAMASAFDARGHCYVEYRLRRADGEYRSILCSGVPRWTPEGAFAGYIASCIDTTDPKQAQVQAFAHQGLESVDHLTRSILHEFNNLLGGILATAEVALGAHADGVSIEQELERIRAATIHGSQIIRQLSDAAANGPETSSATPEVSEKLSKTGTVLVVEDEDMLRLAVSKGLRRRGFSVLDAGDRRAALDLIHSHPGRIQLILLDVMLHGTPSRDIFEQLQRVLPGAKVILTSAYSKETAMKLLGCERVDRFLRKPFHLADLVTSIQDAVA